MTRTSLTRRALAALTLAALALTASSGCSDDQSSNPDPIIHDASSVDTGGDASSDAGVEDASVEDARDDVGEGGDAGDAGGDTGEEIDLCEPNPCTEANRSVCEARGAVVVCGCDDGFRDEAGACVPDAVCDANACVEPNRGECVDSNGVAVCGCDAGYVDRNGSCVLEDPCALDPCQEADRGVCSVGANGTAVCGCDVGFVDDAGQCVPEDPCAMDPCQDPNRGVCSSNAGALTCSCDAGFREDGAGACVDADVCDPNPCTDANRTSCSDDGQGVAVCACDTGYQDDGAGACVLIPPPTCTNQHAAGDSYEPDECISLATAIAPGDTQQHTIEPSGDRDYYVLTPQAGEIFRFEETTSLDSYSVLYDTDGATVLRSTDNESWNWEFETAGPYYVMLRHYSSSRTGSYELSVTSLGFDDHGDTVADATQVAANAPLTGNVETRGDHDVFALPVSAGHIVEFEDTTSEDVYFTLYDTDGSTVLRSTDNETWRWEFEDAGTYYVRVRMYSSTNTGLYDVTVTDLGVDDHGDDPAESTLVSAGAPLTGDIETRGDHDVFAFPVSVGHILEFKDTTSEDVYFTLYDTDGSTVLRSTDNETWRWEFEDAGTYYVRVRMYSSTNTGLYDVTVTDLGVDDHGDDPASASAWAAGQTIDGALETRGDRDVFAFTAQAGHVYRLEETSSIDAYITLRDDTGGILRTQDLDWMQWEFEAGGTYTFEVRYDSSISIGDYTITLTDLGPDDGADTTAAATPIAGPGIVMGSIETYQDRDVYAFTTTAADQIFYIAETSTTNVTLTLYDADGVTVLETASSPEWFARRFAAPGTYYVSVRHGSTSSIGDYALIFEDRGQDDHANGPTMATTIAVDGADNVGELEYRGDTDWFQFTTSAGNVYGVEISGNTRWKATLYAADGATVIDTVTNSTMFPTLDATTTYFVEVETTSSNTLGAYTLSVED